MKKILILKLFLLSIIPSYSMNREDMDNNGRPAQATNNTVQQNNEDDTLQLYRRTLENWDIDRDGYLTFTNLGEVLEGLSHQKVSSEIYHTYPELQTLYERLEYESWNQLLSLWNEEEENHGKPITKTFVSEVLGKSLNFIKCRLEMNSSLKKIFGQWDEEEWKCQQRLEQEHRQLVTNMASTALEKWDMNRLLSYYEVAKLLNAEPQNLKIYYRDLRPIINDNTALRNMFEQKRAEQKRQSAERKQKLCTSIEKAIISWTYEKDGILTYKALKDRHWGSYNALREMIIYTPHLKDLFEGRHQEIRAESKKANSQNNRKRRRSATGPDLEQDIRQNQRRKVNPAAHTNGLRGSVTGKKMEDEEVMRSESDSEEGDSRQKMSSHMLDSDTDTDSSSDEEY